MTTQAIPRVLSAGTLTGSDVKNPQGEKLGQIEEIMISLDSGHVSYAVLSFGGFMGMGDKLFAVPWSKFRPNPEDESMTLNVAKETLQKAPGFDKNDWPDLTQPDWHQNIHQYYGVDPQL